MVEYAVLKGIDELSFSHNTGAEPSFFNAQFMLWEDY